MNGAFAKRHGGSAPGGDESRGEVPEREVSGRELSGNSTGPATASPRKGGLRLSLKGRALRYLAGREHSRAELERKLAAHEEEPGQLARILDELEAKGFISQARVIESVIHRRAERFGAARIRHELSTKGLDAEAVAQAMAGLKATEVERARQVWRSKFGRPPQDAAERGKQMRFLAARGFATEVIRRVVSGADDDH